MYKKIYGLNENYFDDLSASADKFQKAHYLIGLMFVGGSITGNSRFEFRSTDRGLVELVKSELSCEHPIKHYHGESNSLKIGYAPTLCSKLEEFGIVPDKTERHISKAMSEEEFRHFSRAVIDIRGRVYKKDQSVCIEISSYLGFLMEFHEAMAKYAGVKRDAPTRVLQYSGKDVSRVGRFIYEGANSIKKNGIYVQSKKTLIQSAKYHKTIHSNAIRARERIAKFNEFLLAGKSIDESSRLAGYSDITHLNYALKSQTGMTPSELEKQIKQKLSRRVPIEHAVMQEIFERIHNLRLNSPRRTYYGNW